MPSKCSLGLVLNLPLNWLILVPTVTVFLKPQSPIPTGWVPTAVGPGWAWPLRPGRTQLLALNPDPVSKPLGRTELPSSGRARGMRDEEAAFAQSF